MAEQLITYNCEFCGIEHIQRLGNYNRNDHHYCNKGCAVKARWEESKQLKLKLLEEEIECACGCGEILKKYVIDRKDCLSIRERKFIVGHVGNLPNSGQFEKGCEVWNKGISPSEETKQKIREAAIKQFENGVSEEVRIKMSCGLRGILIEEFDGFVTDNDPRKNREERKSHSEWRRKVYERDSYVCQLCGSKSGNGVRVILNAHHMKSWKEYPELRRDLNNGVTLCAECHLYVHSKKYQNELEEN